MSLTFGTGQIIGCAMRQSCGTLTKRARHANYSELAALSQRCSECQPSQLCDVIHNNVTPATKNSCSVKRILFFTTLYSYCKVRYLQIVSPWKVKCRRLNLNILSQFQIKTAFLFNPSVPIIRFIYSTPIVFPLENRVPPVKILQLFT